MQSLLLRIFLAFWLIIAIIIGVAVVGGYSYAERMREAFESFEESDIMLEASSSLQSGGRDGLESWLNTLPRDMRIDVYVIDRSGKDLLNRKLPSSIVQALRRFGGSRNRRQRPLPDSKILRPARPLTRMIGPDGHTYTFFATPKRGPGGQWLLQKTWVHFLLLAILVSAVVSYLLARAISRPVSRFREATVAIAAGNFDTRVAESVGKRRDEIGHLARDFDSMADELQRAWKQQTELARNVSHELRSPLARLRVALELARREAGDLPEFSKIDRETERLDKMIGQILSYAKIESRQGGETTTIQLDELLHSIVEDARYECRSSGIDGVTVELQIEGPIEIRGFSAALSSAFENVLRNALRHSPANHPVTVVLRRENAAAVIEVCDQGSGVDESELDSLFEPFFRSNSALREHGSGGTGLGLAIARRAVQKNHGNIAASNIDEGGLRVVIRLPLQASGTNA